jgi:hypothetical protein
MHRQLTDDFASVSIKLGHYRQFDRLEPAKLFLGSTSHHLLAPACR